jgi:hypothetical protein
VRTIREEFFIERLEHLIRTEEKEGIRSDHVGFITFCIWFPKQQRVPKIGLLFVEEIYGVIKDGNVLVENGVVLLQSGFSLHSDNNIYLQGADWLTSNFELQFFAVCSSLYYNMLFEYLRFKQSLILYET